MNRGKRYLIDQIAETLRKAYKLTTPLDVRNFIQSDLKGKIDEQLFEDSSISGKISKATDGNFCITINTRESPARQKFTIAHELGHLFLHMGFILNPEKWNNLKEYTDSPMYRQGYSEEEYEANEFAGAFLMPEDEYKELFDSNRDISSIARHFDVSYDAALIRGKWLGFIQW